jgi:hypothetical protein
MAKVIVERPRYNSRALNLDEKSQARLWQRFVDRAEILPRRSSPARMRRDLGKSLNENLAPLRRFLDSKCGQHWSKVYSEIRSRINPASAVQMHILQHLDGYVQVHAKAWPDGEFTDSRGRTIFEEWLVNPKTGCLQRNEAYRYRYDRWRRKSNEPAVANVRIINRRSFREIDGIWYEIGYRKVSLAKSEIAPNCKSDESAGVYDVLMKCVPTIGELIREYRTCIYAASKRQLNSDEIRRLGLREETKVLPNR